MEWIYLSPHFDDIAYSCGGLVWEQVNSGQRVSIWTICAAYPPSGPLSSFARDLHERWDTGRAAVQQRRKEDRISSRLMGANPRHFSIPDAIYRRSSIDGRFVYASEQELFAELHPHEADLVQKLRTELDSALPTECELVCPLALGGHVDHRLVRSAVQCLNRQLWYYADYPYLLDLVQDQVKMYAGLSLQVFPISADGLDIWVDAVAAHASQLSTFWPGFEEMRSAIRSYWSQFEGLRLWRVS